MRFTRKNNVKRVCVSLTTKALLQLENLSRHMGLDMSNTLSAIMQEFIDDPEVRNKFQAFKIDIQRGGFWHEPGGRKAVNYLIPVDVIEHPLARQEAEATNFSRFVRVLIHFNHFRKVVEDYVDFEGEFIRKIRDAGLEVVSYSHFDHVLIIRIDTGHLTYISIPVA